MKPCHPVNVSFLSTSFPRFDNDFSGNFVHRYAQELCDLGAHIEIVVPDDPAALPLAEKFSLVRFPYFFPRSWQKLAYGSGIINQRSVLAWLQLPFLFICFFITALRSTRKTQLAHAFWSASGIVAVAVSYFKPRPVVVTLWGSDKLILQLPFLSNLIIRILNKADAIICEDKNLKSSLVARGMDCQKITLIQNGIDCSIFRPSDSLKAKNHLNLQAEERIILSIGSLNKTKNHSLLINTFAETAALNNTWRLYIIGEGVERKCLEKQILDLGLNKKVILLGLQNHSSLPQWLNAADIFVLPSQSEGTPNALLEAMACGLPVIASNVGGIPELIQDNIEGLLFESGSKDDLKEKLNRLIQDKGLQKTLAENAGKKITSQYGSWKTQAEKLLSLYEQLLSSRIN